MERGGIVCTILIFGPYHVDTFEIHNNMVTVTILGTYEPMNGRTYFTYLYISGSWRAGGHPPPSTHPLASDRLRKSEHHHHYSHLLDE
jgi:hypothetical protein